MPNVKPNPKKLRRVSAKVDNTGFLDYILIANHQDILTFPLRPELAATTSYKTFATAIGAFGSDPVWFKVDCKRNTIKVNSKNLGTLNDSSAVETTVGFSLDSNEETLGFIEMYKRSEVQIVLPKASGKMIWVGHKESPCVMQEFASEESLEKTAEDIVFVTKPYARIYLPDDLVLVTVTELDGPPR
jgi:hypothetical protein